MTRRESRAAPPSRPAVAVLGGTGWVGRHVCAALARRGHDVLVVARRPAPHVAAHRFAGLDLRTTPADHLARLLRAEGVGTVVNATDAANATDGWSGSEEEMAVLNVDLVRRLVAAMSTLPHGSRLVHVGTLHEYGDVPPGTVMHEALTPRPASAYTRTKLAGSRTVLEAARRGEVDGLVLRLANVSGPHPSPASFPGKLVGMLREAVASGRPMTVGVTDSGRDFVDVRDAAAAVVGAVGSSVTGKVVNIGGGRAVSMDELVRLFVVGAGFPLGRLDARRREVGSLGGSWTRADIRLAGELLHWRPRIDLARSLRDMWETAEAERRTTGPV
ncbi:NAD-dependent epimerase/dehydratase family protein [Streptomyces liangshanensis]|uniref:NAD-dependent epimerase/dehydratase family protein n=1 Tax=Streptomyces liangshanensis TaxID=2717324 RepID=A0A6G9GUC0_9ACTN|nr:NAD-dependent epimerase/dehydratase family protein [Streptomyces liangshanensis]QIQ01863.1 NAD-dependent epimerase/dehydratase family protein [Streptomyces liangshanensis]